MRNIILVCLFIFGLTAVAQQKYGRVATKEETLNNFMKRLAAFVCPGHYNTSEINSTPGTLYYSEETVLTTFRNLYENPGYLKVIQEQIKKHNPDAIVTEIKEPKGEVKSRGPAHYIKVKTATQEMDVMVGPYTNPIRCVFVKGPEKKDPWIGGPNSRDLEAAR